MVYKYLGSMGIYVGHTQHDTDTGTQQTLKVVYGKQWHGCVCMRAFVLMCIETFND